MTQSDVVNYLINIKIKRNIWCYALKYNNYNQFKTSLYDTNDKDINIYENIYKNSKKVFTTYKNTLFNPYHNGFVEGNNNFIKVLKRIAFGFRSFRRFKARIMICKNLLHMKRADA